MLRNMILSSRNRKRPARFVAGLAIAALAVPALLLPTAVGAATDDKNTPARKYGRGLAGMTLGVLEVPGNIVQETRTNGALSGFTVGLFMGLGKLVVRTVTGVFEFVTAPFPVPEGFRPVLQPEFPWQYFESQPGRIYGFSDVYLYEEELELDRVPGADIDRRFGALVVSFPGNLLFAFDSDIIPEAGEKRLEGLVKTLKKHDDTSIVVVGYADSTGNSAYNRSLSKRRAVSVREFLVGQGIAGSRIQTTGFGDSYPIASNDTSSGRYKNRRVEVELRSSGVGAFR